MKKRSISITRRLVIGVFLLELISALTLVVAVSVDELHVQRRAMDANLAEAAESLKALVLSAGAAGNNDALNLRGVRLDRHAVYRIEADQGRVLATAGDVQTTFEHVAGSNGFHNVVLSGHHYRILVLHTTRVLDRDDAGSDEVQNVTILYGAPTGRVWHEVLEGVRFFSIATLVLMGVTAILISFLVRTNLAPVHELAREADQIRSHNWQFAAPMSAKERVELRPLANALESALARVQRSFEQQRQFTHDAAHELKTDAAIIKSSLQLLSMRKRTAEEYDRGLAQTLVDFSRLESTIQNLLDLARLEESASHARLGEKLPSCDLQSAVQDAIQHCGPLAELKGVYVTLDSEQNLSVQLDSHDAILLCSNLLMNALQHTPEPGEVNIALIRSTPGGIPSAILTVRDHGDGIAERDIPHLFDAFYRGDPSRSRKSGGTGLGLSICKAICERIGGKIEISNHEGGGAQAMVTLPLC